MFSGGGGSVGLDVLGQVLLSVRTVLQSLVVNAPGRKDTANNERRAVDKENRLVKTTTTEKPHQIHPQEDGITHNNNHE